MANFLGFIITIGKKQITKQASAPRLQPANINIRSHLLTANMSQRTDSLKSASRFTRNAAQSARLMK
jgi:hypothetical protein